MVTPFNAEDITEEMPKTMYLAKVPRVCSANLPTLLQRFLTPLAPQVNRESFSRGTFIERHSEIGHIIGVSTACFDSVRLLQLY